MVFSNFLPLFKLARSAPVRRAFSYLGDFQNDRYMQIPLHFR